MEVIVVNVAEVAEHNSGPGGDRALYFGPNNSLAQSCPVVTRAGNGAF